MAMLAAAVERGQKGGKPDATVAPAPPDFIGKCFSTPGGAWVATAQAMEIDSGYGGFQMRWGLAHVNAGGQSTTVFPSEGAKPLSADGMNYNSSPDSYEIELAAHDYDGDGTPEAIVTLSGKHHEGERFSAGRIYTLSKGTVELYAPARDLFFDSVKDADGDGRPDLVVFPFSTVQESCGSGFGFRVSGPQLLAHARPDGTFSTSDDVAAKAAREACPKNPATVVDKGSEQDTDAAARNVACARIWGTPAAEVKKRIAAECKSHKPNASCAEGACLDGKTLQAWAERQPPLVLK